MRSSRVISILSLKSSPDTLEHNVAKDAGPRKGVSIMALESDLEVEMEIPTNNSQTFLLSTISTPVAFQPEPVSFACILHNHMNHISIAERYSWLEEKATLWSSDHSFSTFCGALMQADQIIAEPPPSSCQNQYSGVRRSKDPAVSYS
ncbi:unnamed protein product [Sphenostylis stenocarpa]|uniref:Uncharacterized protein n=1 Tax=Sphenostylis stenocarpa TaxID=92480 RepID=A0AA86S151_9FABA|nr:unnamed protein product [Sphenostylis stenocarpa]